LDWAGADWAGLWAGALVCAAAGTAIAITIAVKSSFIINLQQIG
jgi:hypothetical protein